MRPVQNLSLRKSLVLYIVLFVMFALALSIMTASVCETVANKINEKYPNTGEKYYLTNEQGERLGEGTYIYKELPVLNEQDEQLLAILDLLPTVTPPIYSAFCIIAAALLFYKNKLKKPLAELRAASEKIANNDLDFSIDYDSNDELGQLCASFEIMRTTLADNFSKMWRQVEERKALNAAFAHDLRTPLTVLKGYNEMLQASDNSQTRETAATMGKHISRMENYVSSMSNLRRMEDTQPDYKLIDLQPLVSSLYDSAKIVCTKNGKELILQNNIPILQLSLDSAFISQVCNNLIYNVTIDLINSGTEFNYIFANNDMMAQGCYNALKDAGKENIPIVSTGGSPDGFKMLQDGIEAANMTAPVSIQGVKTFMNLYNKVALGEDPAEKFTALPVIPVSADDTSSYIAWDDYAAAYKYLGENK